MLGFRPFYESYPLPRLILVLAALPLLLSGCSDDPVDPIPDTGRRDAGGTPDVGGGTDAPATPDTPPADPCADGVQNNRETDVDCGGGECAPCAEGQGCFVGTDCAMGRCDEGTCNALVDPGIRNIEVVMDTMTGARSTHCLTVECPAGKQVIGGGFESETGTPEAHDDVNQPASDTAWRVCSQSFADDVITNVYAVCAEVDDYSRAGMDAVISPRDGAAHREAVDVGCESGHPTAVGWGPLTGRRDDQIRYTPFAAELVGSPLMPRAVYQLWPSEIVRFDAEVRAHVVCASAVAPTVVRETARVDLGAIGCAIARCPAGQVRVGGGHRVVETDDSNYADMHRLKASRPEGADGWLACFHNNTVNEADVTAMVHCVETP